MLSLVSRLLGLERRLRGRLATEVVVVVVVVVEVFVVAFESVLLLADLYKFIDSFTSPVYQIYRGKPNI